MTAAQRRIGRRILDARTTASLSQQQLADRVELSRSSIANIEAGRQSIDAVQLGLFARALRVSLDDLLRADDLPPEPPPLPAPHLVTIERVYQVTCQTCAPGQPFDVRATRPEIQASRRDHIAEMRGRAS